MKLYYIWIKEFKNIHEQGISLSDKYVINYDKFTEILDIKENPKYIPNFFPGKVVEITGIIGSNGAGKSNFFEVIKYILASFSDGAWAGYGLKSIVVAENMIFYHETLKIKNLADLKRRNFVCLPFEHSIAHYQTGKGKTANMYSRDQRLEDNGYIYYSNAFDLRLEDRQFALVDVSTNHLVWADKAHSHINDGLENLTAYYRAETQRQLDFLSNSVTSLPFRLPNSVFVTIDDKMDSRVSPYSKAFEDTGLTKFKDFGLYRINRKLTEEEEEKQDILKPYYRRLFLYKLLLVLQLNDPNLFDKTEGFEFEEIIVNGSNEDLIRFYTNQKLVDVTDFLASLDNLIAAGEVIPQRIDLNNEVSKRYSSLKLNFPNGDRSLFLNFVRQFKKISGDKNFLAFYWNGLSSGELAMLNLYSRLYFGLDSLLMRNKQHLVALIDEGETNLHPKWQAEFLSNVIQFFNDHFQGNTVQLIATSHSPFLISDLPKSKINFLDKDEKGNCLILNPALEHKHTFGANIHTLYADAFFMKNTLMGDFAKQKIDKLIGIVNKEQEFNEEFVNWQIVEACIALIGEPILKGMLQRQLSFSRQATVDDLSALKAQLLELNQRIDKLEGGNGTN